MDNISNIEKPNLPEIKIVLDIDLIDGKQSFVRTIVLTKQLTKENYKELYPNTDNVTFEEAVHNYGCDICNVRCNVNNSIYTNSEYQGCDVCTNCVNNAMKTLQPETGWNPGPVYSLEKISKLNRII